MIQFQPLTGKDAGCLMALYQEYLTNGETLAEGTRRAWDRGVCFGTKAVDGEEMVGFFSMRRGLELTYPHPELEEEVRAAAGGERIYTSDALLVLPRYRGSAISERLVGDTAARFREREKGVVMTEIWVYPDGSSPAKRVLETIGDVFFRKYVPDFYREFPRYHMRCPICGENCKCSAWIELARPGRTEKGGGL